MYLALIFSGVILIWAIALIVCTRMFKRNDYRDSSIFAGILALVFGVVILIVNFVVDADQLRDIEQLELRNERICIFQDKTNELTIAFEDLLANQFPEQERKIFEGISPENIDIYFAKYPEIQSINGFINLADKIKELNNELYGEKLRLAELGYEVRYRMVNPWLFQNLITDVPEDLQSIVYYE